MDVSLLVQTRALYHRSLYGLEREEKNFLTHSKPIFEQYVEKPVNLLLQEFNKKTFSKADES